MKLNILQIGEPVLRQPARVLSKEEILSPRIQQLIEFMKETMHDAPGVGLAAPQIGESLQIITIEDKKEYTADATPEQLAQRERKPVALHVVINPILTVVSEKKVEFYEGCLSAAGLVGAVPRALEVKVDCLNERAEPVTLSARGWYARILQHETEHLHGTLCIDHMIPRTLMTVQNYIKYWR